MSEIDQQFIEFVVKSLVGKPDAVQVTRRIDEKGVLLELTVDPEDLGRVIGKRGATAQSLRTLLRALGTKNDARYNLKIIDNGPEDGKPARAEDENDKPAKKRTSKKPAAPADDDNAVAVAEPDETSADSEGTEAVEEDSATATSDRIAKARAELADLDDLDV